MQLFLYYNFPPPIRNYAAVIFQYDGCIPAYASGIPELRRLHNLRMVYTKHPVWYIPYESFGIYHTGIYYL
ncbi:MAG: hypothetical protein LBV64_06390 [Mediterranea sp.]|nr:hypothetical protein [Mediterranea sp.]